MANTIVRVEVRDGKAFEVTYTESAAVEVNALEQRLFTFLQERLSSLVINVPPETRLEDHILASAKALATDLAALVDKFEPNVATPR